MSVLVLRWIGILINAAEMIFLCNKLFEPKSSRKITFCAILVYFLFYEISAEFFWSNMIILIVNIVLLIGVIYVSFKGDVVDNYLTYAAVTIFLMLGTLTYGNLAGNIYRGITGTDAPLWVTGENIQIAGIFLLCIRVILDVFVCLLIIPKIKSRIEKWSRKAKFLAMVYPVADGCGVIAMSIYMGNGIDLQKYPLAYFIATAILATVGLVFIVVMIMRMCINKKEVDIIEREIQGQHRLYEEVGLLQENIRELRHDLANYIVAGGEESKVAILGYCNTLQERLREYDELDRH